MKIIDLLNIWVEDRNKLPKKIKVDDETYVYDNRLNLYKIPKKDYFLISNYLNCVEKLDIEVEVIEEEEIDELRIAGITTEEMESKIKLKEVLNDTLYNIKEKINELVREVNKIKKQLEEQETEDIDTTERELNKMF